MHKYGKYTPSHAHTRGRPFDAFCYLFAARSPTTDETPQDSVFLAQFQGQFLLTAAYQCALSSGLVICVARERASGDIRDTSSQI
jgi:hypothetical protein